MLFTEDMGVFFLCSRKILACQRFIADQGISSIDQVAESRIIQCLTTEGLAGRIDILAADLEEAVGLAELCQPVKLLRCVPGGHIGDGVKAILLNDIHQLIQIIILKLLCLLIAGDGITHIAQIGVGRNTAVFMNHFHKIGNRGAFVGGIDIEFLHHIAFQRAQNVILVVLRGLMAVGDLVNDLLRKR